MVKVVRRYDILNGNTKNKLKGFQYQWTHKYFISSPNSIKTTQSSSALNPERIKFQTQARCSFFARNVTLNGLHVWYFMVIRRFIFPRMQCQCPFTSDRKFFMAYTKTIIQQKKILGSTHFLPEYGSTRLRGTSSSKDKFLSSILHKPLWHNSDKTIIKMTDNGIEHR